MLTLTPMFITPIPAAAPAAASLHGPFSLLAQAEYVARILRRLDDDAEIESACPNGPWWVRAGAGP